MAKGGYREGAGRKRITVNRLDIKVYCRLSEKENGLLKEKQLKTISVSLNISDRQYWIK